MRYRITDKKTTTNTGRVESGEVHLFYRHSELTNDEALTLLLTKYEKIREIIQREYENERRGR